MAPAGAPPTRDDKKCVLDSPRKSHPSKKNLPRELEEVSAYKKEFLPRGAKVLSSLVFESNWKL